MLLSKKSEAKLHPTNIKHYKEKGYNIPYKKDKYGKIYVPQGTKIVVETNDLFSGTDIEVEVKCDYCHINVYLIPFHRHYKAMQDDGRNCCNSCRNKKSGTTRKKMYEDGNLISKTIRKDIDDDEVIKLYNEGYSSKDISDIYGCSAVCIRNRLKKSGIARRIIIAPDIKKEELYNLYVVERKSSEEIANIIGVGSTWICNKLKLFEIEARKTPNEYTKTERINKFGSKREDHPLWNGGITCLNNHLRKIIKPWIYESYRVGNEKCAISGNKVEVAHHLYGFNMIVKETLDTLNLSVCKNIGDYCKTDLELIEQKCLELHFTYGYGVCLTNKIHNLFHKIYGKGNNNLEQFEEFKIRYSNGEFNKVKNVSS